MTPAERMAAAHRREHMARLARDSTTPRRATEARINRLAAKRQARLTPGGTA